MIRKNNRRNQENREEAERHPVSPIMDGGRPYSDDKRKRGPGRQSGDVL
jgi:hypothetical protein